MDIKEILQTIESAERQRDSGNNNDRADFLLRLATAKSLAVIARAADFYMATSPLTIYPDSAPEVPAEVQPSPEAHMFEVGDEVMVESTSSANWSHHGVKGVIIRIEGDEPRYQAEFPDGSKEWFYADELTLLPKGGTQ